MMDRGAENPQMEGFELGRPALVCRWRLAGARLPLENRHLRALGGRTVAGRRLAPPLLSWVKQHIEWTLAEGASGCPDGVLMLLVDESGRAAMTVGPFEPLGVRTSSALAERARSSAAEAGATGVAPETLWLVREDELLWGTRPGDVASGSASLMADLAKTLGFPVARQDGLAEEVIAGTVAFDEAFLVSDEYGFVPATNAGGPRSLRFAEGYDRLLERTRAR